VENETKPVADLRGANLRGADLTGAILDGANLRRVSLRLTRVTDEALQSAITD